jgi:hypothetical protein
MRTKTYIFLIALLLALTVPLSVSATPNIIGPDIRIIDNNIIVNLSIADISELERTIKSGIDQEIIFTVELLRVWRFWPDEFVVSKRIDKTIKYDNLRQQYQASSYNGISHIKKNFKDYNSMKNWIFSVKKINLANIKELEPSNYYIRIVVESKSIEHLPIVGFLMHFIPEVEMSMAKESQPFMVGNNK